MDASTRWAIGDCADGPTRLLTRSVTLDSLLGGTADMPGTLEAAMEDGSVPQPYVVLPPIESQEVWAAGVTYVRSRDARKEEAEDGGDVYARVYEATRPELFFKAPGWRVCGPDMPIAVRTDSDWDVPEAEVALVMSAQGEIVGFTAGNDVSSRSIEGANPLYLPQAKVYDRSCALGPCILMSTGSTPEFTISLAIRRDGAEIYRESASTALLKRSFDELRDYLFRALTFPAGAILMTGTCLVPPFDISLRPGDVTAVEVSAIGVLENRVELTGRSEGA